MTSPCLCSRPPWSCLLDVLQQTTRVSYYGFLRTLANHKGLNQTVGKLKIIIITDS